MLPVGKVGNYSSLQNSLFFKFTHYSSWNWLQNPLVTRSKEYNFNLYFTSVTDVSCNFDKVLYLLILERVQPPILDNRYTSWREIDKALLSRQRLFFSIFHLEDLKPYAGNNIILGIIIAGYL